MSKSVNEDLSAGDFFFKSMHLENGLDHVEKLMVALKIIILTNGKQFGGGKRELLLYSTTNCPPSKE